MGWAVVVILLLSSPMVTPSSEGGDRGVLMVQFDIE